MSCNVDRLTKYSQLRLDRRDLPMNALRACLSTIAALLFLLPLSAHAAKPRTLIATVERVSDGDTVVAITANQTMLRLLGIDA